MTTVIEAKNTLQEISDENSRIFLSLQRTSETLQSEFYTAGEKINTEFQKTINTMTATDARKALAEIDAVLNTQSLEEFDSAKKLRETALKTRKTLDEKYGSGENLSRKERELANEAREAEYDYNKNRELLDIYSHTLRYVDKFNEKYAGKEQIDKADIAYFSRFRLGGIFDRHYSEGRKIIAKLKKDGFDVVKALKTRDGLEKEAVKLKKNSASKQEERDITLKDLKLYTKAKSFIKTDDEILASITADIAQEAMNEENFDLFVSKFAKDVPADIVVLGGKRAIYAQLGKAVSGAMDIVRTADESIEDPLEKLSRAASRNSYARIRGGFDPDEINESFAKMHEGVANLNTEVKEAIKFIKSFNVQKGDIKDVGTAPLKAITALIAGKMKGFDITIPEEQSSNIRTSDFSTEILEKSVSGISVDIPDFSSNISIPDISISDSISSIDIGGGLSGGGGASSDW